MDYKDKIGIIADRIIADCKSYDVDLKLVIDEIERISNRKEDLMERLKDNDDEFGIQAFFEDIVMPTEEEMEQQMLDNLSYMTKCIEAINYVCYEENCPKRLMDDSNIKKNDDSEKFALIWDEEFGDYIIFENCTDDLSDDFS